VTEQWCIGEQESIYYSLRRTAFTFIVTMYDVCCTIGLNIVYQHRYFNSPLFLVSKLYLLALLVSLYWFFCHTTIVYSGIYVLLIPISISMVKKDIQNAHIPEC